jgi:DNA ligase-1
MRSFVQLANAVAATAKKLEKLRLISEFFQSLSIPDAAIAARFLSAHAFAAHDERTIGVGGAMLVDVIADLSGHPSQNLGAAYRKHGDLGDLAADLLSAKHPEADLSLAGAAQLFDQVAAFRSQSEKAQLLRSAFRQSSPDDIRYVVKIITGDLRIGSKESLVEEAIAKAFSQSLAEVRRSNMMLGDIGETLALAAQNNLGSAAVRLFHPLGFMLAAPVETARGLFEKVQTEPRQDKPAFLVEEKYDGIRAQIHKDAAGRARMFSRTRDELTEFPELIPIASQLPGEFILDGEIVAWRDSRPLPFTELQKRLGRKHLDLFIQSDIPVVFVAFDLLYQNRELLLDEPLSQRKSRLAALLEGAPAALRSAIYTESRSAEAVQQAFKNALAAGHEGVVAKFIASPYAPGRRGGYWFKLKEPYATLDVVVTAVEYGHGKRHKLLSDYTFAIRNGDQLLNVGKAYSGLTDLEIAELTEFFKVHTIEDHGQVRTVEPLMVLEVAFNNIQKSSRHASGYALRFPRIVRLRTDKSPSDIDTLATVAFFFAKQTTIPSP